MNTLRRIRVGLIALLSVHLLLPQPLFAIDTTVSTPPLVDGPFLITAYSFSGHSLQYVQLSNESSSLASLDGWKVQTNWLDGFWQTTELSGSVQPEKKATVAQSTVLPGATFPFDSVDTPGDPRLDEIRLVPPQGSGLLDSIVSVSIKDNGSSMTPRDTSTDPETFYFERNRSASTGNYLSTFTASATPPAQIVSDPLYVPAATSPLQIVEIYPNASDCSPLTDGALCYDYVKLFNASSQPVSLESFRIRTGTVAQAATSSNTIYPTGSLASGAYLSIPQSLS